MSAEGQSPTDERRPSVAWLTGVSWASLLLFAGAAALVSVTLKDLAADFGIGFALRGLLAWSRSLVLAASALTMGLLADRFGKRRLLTGGMCLVAAALLWIGRAATYPSLLGAMMLLGVGMGSIDALVSPLVADLHPRNVAGQMHVLHGFFPAGILLFSWAVGAALDRGLDWRVPFMFAAAPVLAGGLAFAAGRYPTPARRCGAGPLSARAILRNRTFWLLSLAMALTAGSEGGLIFWTPNFVQVEYGASAGVGAGALVAFSLAMAAGRFGAGAASRAMPVGRMMVAVAFVGAGATAALALVDRLPVTVAMLALAGLCLACFWPGVLTLAVSRIAAGSATLLSMLAVAGIIGFGAVPFAVGVLAERFGLRVGLLLVPLALAASGAVLVAVFRVSEAAPPPVH